MSRTIDEILEADTIDDFAYMSRSVMVGRINQLAAEVRRLREREKVLEAEVAAPILTAVNRLADQLADERSRSKVLTEALKWYEKWVGECNRDGAEGDTARDRLAKDVGNCARAALASGMKEPE